MRYVYSACFYPEEAGRFSVIFTDFELATFGDDLADAMYMAVDAAGGRILGMLEAGETLPEPSMIQQVQPEDPGGFVSLVYIDLDGIKETCDLTQITTAP